MEHFDRGIYLYSQNQGDLYQSLCENIKENDMEVTESPIIANLAHDQPGSYLSDQIGSHNLGSLN